MNLFKVQTWTFMKRLRPAVLLLSVISMAFWVQSCEEPYDYMMSMSPHEQAEAMVGTWVLTRAGTCPPMPDGNGEEHITDNLDTPLEYIEITGSDITFHFSEPVPVYFIGEATGNIPEEHEKTQSFKVKHCIGGIPNLTAIDAGTEDSPSFAFCYSESDPAGANEFIFYTRDDVHAVRTILNFYIEGFYFEFERE